MTYIVNENCIKCKYMDCVEVCPVDCFYEGENMLVIHPDECIDCGVCEPECPVDAIKPDTEPGLEKWLEINAKYAQVWPNITIKLSRRLMPSSEGKPDKANWLSQKLLARVNQEAGRVRRTYSPAWLQIEIENPRWMSCFGFRPRNRPVNFEVIIRGSSTG